MDAFFVGRTRNTGLMHSRIIRLSDDEMREAQRGGLDRLSESRKSGRHASRSEEHRSYWHRMVDDMSAATAEYAFAKLLNIEWQTRLNTFHTIADVGDTWEVRSVLDPGHCLIVRDDDPDERHYVLIAADQAPAFRVLGMMRGAEAKTGRYGRNPHGQRPAFFVPPRDLTPFTPDPQEAP